MIDRSRLSPRTLERLEEREAIMIEDGGLSAPQAAQAALQDALRHVLQSFTGSAWKSAKLTGSFGP